MIKREDTRFSDCVRLGSLLKSIPKFKLHGDDKFYAIGSCFARGLEQSLQKHNIAC